MVASHSLSMVDSNLSGDLSSMFWVKWLPPIRSEYRTQNFFRWEGGQFLLCGSVGQKTKIYPSHPTVELKVHLEQSEGSIRGNLVLLTSLTVLLL